jgi:subtilisin family serine protease
MPAEPRTRPRPRPAVLLALLLLLASAGARALGGARSIVPGDIPGTSPDPRPDDGMESVVIRFHPPYDALVERIRAAGGEVRHAFAIVDAVSARVPRAAIPALGRFAGAGSITKDPAIPAPERVTVDRFDRVLPMERRDDDRSIVAESVSVLATPDIVALAAAHPDSYSVNAGILGVASLHAAGIAGQGTVVAVIDSGLKPNFPHLELDGSILGGEDFAHDGFSWVSPLNDGHGTFVAGMISGNILAQISTTSPFLRALRLYAPGAIVGTNGVPILGSAPLSGIFAMRVFSPFIAIPTSAIIEAMERVLDLRDAYHQGNPGGLDIGVVNMSLSSVTLDPGRDLLQAAADKLVEQGVVVVVSAGNAGPSGLTTGSPATAFGALDVGATNLAHNERILRDLQWGAGVGFRYRPFDGPETALFSSRGPIADGRAAPDVTASGYASMGLGFGPPNGISLSSGTSFSSPSIAGVAALLRQGAPGATARQIRNAIVMTANPDYLADGSTWSDQGAGYVNGQAAWDLLKAGGAPDTPVPPPHALSSVAANLSSNAIPVDSGSVARRMGPLQPGGRAEIFYQVPPNVQAVNLTVTPIRPAEPGPVNELFGDDLILTVHSAKTGRHRTFFGDGDYLRQTLVLGTDPVVFPLQTFEPGVLRVTVTGDWTNAGVMSADVSIAVVQVPAPVQSRIGRISEFQTIAIPFTVPAGAQRLEARLSWRQGWENIPLNDLDLTLVNPYDFPDYGAATLNAPEQTTIVDPSPGQWTALVYGFEMPVQPDQFKLRIVIDGTVVR